MRGNVARDLAALNRIELLPWDDWGMLLRLGQEDATPTEDLARLDRAAEIGRAPERWFSELRTLYRDDRELRVPERVKNWETGAEEFVPAAA